MKDSIFTGSYIWQQIEELRTEIVQVKTGIAAIKEQQTQPGVSDLSLPIRLLEEQLAIKRKVLEVLETKPYKEASNA